MPSMPPIPPAGIAGSSSAQGTVREHLGCLGPCSVRASAARPDRGVPRGAGFT